MKTKKLLSLLLLLSLVLTQLNVIVNAEIYLSFEQTATTVNSGDFSKHSDYSVTEFNKSANKISFKIRNQTGGELCPQLVFFTIDQDHTLTYIDIMAISLSAGQEKSVSKEFLAGWRMVLIDDFRTLRPILGTSIYGISLDTVGTHTFSQAVYGYESQTGLTVTIDANGNESDVQVAIDGDTAFEITQPQDCNFTVTPKTGLDVGTYQANIIVTDSKGGAACFSVSYTVDRAGLTVTAENKDINYGDEIPSYSAKITGFVNNEDESVLTGVPAFACNYAKGSNVDEYDITVTQGELAADNYTFAFVSGKLTVSPKTSGIAVDSIANVTYTGLEQTPVPVVKDGNETLTEGTYYTVAYSENVNAGTATVTITGIGNYLGSSASTTFEIEKATLTVTAADNSITFNSDAPSYSVSYSGFVNNEDESVLTGVPAFACNYAKGSNVDEYDITVTQGGLAADNYTFAFVSGKLTVSPKTSGIAVDSIANVTYTGIAQTPVTVVKDGGETLTEGTHYTVAYSENVNVGTATVTITGIGNYLGSSASTTFEILDSRKL